MGEMPPIYTATMAKVLEDQGKYWEALKIYRHLLSMEPGRSDFLSALDRIRRRMGLTSQKALISLFEEWIDLLLMKVRMDRLEQLKKTVKG